MPQDTPEQLKFEFGRIDPIGERYPRRHEYRQIRTPRELVTESAHATVDFFRNPKVAKRAVGALIGLAVTTSAVAGWVAKDEYDEYKRSLKPVYDIDDYVDDFVDCSDGVSPNQTDLVYDPEFNYAGLYDRIALFDLEAWSNLRAELLYASIFPSDAAKELNRYLEDSPVEVDFDIDWSVEENYADGRSMQERVTKDGVANLATAMFSIPKTLYEYSGIKKIKIVDEIKSLKSDEQIAYETNKATPPFVVDEYNYYAGQYHKKDGTVLLPKSALVDGALLTQILFHEVIGHGVMMANCEPFTDKDWQDLNTGSGVDFLYSPEWRRTTELNKLFESGIITKGAYAGTDPREDVAEASTFLAPAYAEKQYRGEVDANNGTVVDEKVSLVFNRVTEIEPDFARFLALQFEMQQLTASKLYQALFDTIG